MAGELPLLPLTTARFKALMINAWSFSSLQVFEKCPQQAKLKYVDKIPEPQNEYASRGVNVHDAAEAYVRGETEALASELFSFRSELDAVRRLYAEGKVTVEQEWAHDAEWVATAWRDKSTWVRIKLDIFVHMSETAGLVVDLKTGRKSGNELKHAEQGQLYAAAAMLRFPKLQTVVVEFWYVDKDELTRSTYTRAQCEKFLASYTRRGDRMTTATSFPAKPSIFNCKWCPYRPEEVGGDGHCKQGVGLINVMPKRR